MSDKIKDYIVIITFSLIIFGTLFINTITPDSTVSKSERKSLQQFPEIALESIFEKGDETKKITFKKIVENFNGEVPSRFEDLITLDGVGRKTADVMIAVAFSGDAIPVDTHVFRVSNRIGLAKAKNVLQTELQLQKAIDKSKWSNMHHYILWHGRRVCKARNPDCENCEINEYCDYYRKNK